MIETTLQHLLDLPQRDRNGIVTNKPHIDIYLGNTRVYKRTAKALLFAFCPDNGRFLEPVNGSLAVRLPQGFSNSLTVKLAVLYMEQCLLTPAVRDASWRVHGDIASHINLAEFFAFVEMPEAAFDLETGILCRLQEHPLRFDQICAVWARDSKLHPSK